jgi:hypothetical protein
MPMQRSTIHCDLALHCDRALVYTVVIHGSRLSPRGNIMLGFTLLSNGQGHELDPLYPGFFMTS